MGKSCTHQLPIQSSGLISCDMFLAFEYVSVSIRVLLALRANIDELMAVKLNIYISIAIALDESIFLDVLNFQMKNIKSRVLEATPMGGATSKRANDVVCLLLLS